MGTQQGLGNEHENCCAQHELTRKDIYTRIDRPTMKKI